jgi:hypothetical protein
VEPLAQNITTLSERKILLQITTHSTHDTVNRSAIAFQKRFEQRLVFPHSEQRERAPGASQFLGLRKDEKAAAMCEFERK